MILVIDVRKPYNILLVTPVTKVNYMLNQEDIGKVIAYAILLVVFTVLTNKLQDPCWTTFLHFLEKEVSCVYLRKSSCPNNMLVVK